MFDIVNQEGPDAADHALAALPTKTSLPAPLTEPDCDLRTLPSLMLDAQRLRDSSLAATATGDGFRCAVLLWCASWLQVPAASLPDDEVELARLAGYGRDISTFKTDWQNGGGRGWVKCSDGRLYHPVLAEKAREAWERRKSHSERGRRGNAIRWGSQEDRTANAQGSRSDGNSDRARIAKKERIERKKEYAASLRSAQRPPRDEGEGERDPADLISGQPDISLRSIKETIENNGAFGGRLAAFDAFYAAYPRKDGKGSARKAWINAIRKAAPDEIMAGLARYQFNDDPKYRPMPATWLNDERWTSVPPPRPAPVSELRGGL